ncbi:DNA repair protein rad5 [Penicillium verhagenii]|nr:DNA repair protein rad5 [Penicillium verhagenii]
MSEDLEDQRPLKRPRFFPNPERIAQNGANYTLTAHERENHTEQHGQDNSEGIQPFNHVPSNYVNPDENSPKASIPPLNTDTPHSIIANPNTASPLQNEGTVVDPISPGFNVDLFTSIIGEQLPPTSIQIIRTAASNNLERAVNIYFDGSWKKPVKPSPRTSSIPIRDSPSTEYNSVSQKLPPSRFIGAFGVGGWATRSGPALLKHGDPVKIERARSQPSTKRVRGGKMMINHKGDVLTRFTNVLGQEVGRLPHETAEWVSILIDQNICHFEGVCVFSDDTLRVNDTIYLQLRCFLRRESFQRSVFMGTSASDNRSLGIFEEKENAEEKNLRLRQVSLVKLFDAIDLKPTSTNPTTEKHKKSGILRAAEMAEQYDGVKKEKPKGSKGAEDSSEEEDTAELAQDQLDALYRKAQSFDFNMPEAEPAPTFRMHLRKYQKQALHWMLSKEKDNKEARENSMHPLWEQYTWPVKGSDDEELPVFEGIDHFYVNPYSGDLSVDFPTQEQHCLGGILADEMGLGKTIEMMSLIHSHRTEPNPQFSNGVGSVNNLARVPESRGVTSAPYTTLVVAPTSLISQWESEALKASQEGSMRVLMYYGGDKVSNLRDLCCESNYLNAPNVIITSFGTVLSEFTSLASQSATSASAQGGLFSVEFFRIILDEAHTIKNRRSKTTKACCELKTTHRWALTGTPIVNRLEDLFSLVRFLKVEPWSNFSFWKTFITVPFESKEYIRALNVVQSVLEPLVLRRTKNMKTPEGEPLKEREIYDCIYNRAKQTFRENVEAGTLLKSYSTIFAQILRLRQTCCHPILTRNKDLVADEEVAAAAADATNEMKDDMDLQQLIQQFSASTSGNAESEDRSVTFTAHALRQIQTESSGECPICCEEPMLDPAVTACWHSAFQFDADGRVCFQRHAPNCLAGSPRISLRRINPLSPSAHTSAKIHALIAHLSRVPPGHKSVVFSQFTSFLDLIGPQLTAVGISHLRLDGSMPQKQRKVVLEDFTKEATYEDEIVDSDIENNGRPPSSKQTPTVLLISLRAGGVGLNLTVASNVFLMDPWWSFAVEAQAIDRVHRMGQTRDVSVTRFIIKDSIEGRMLRVQERKMNIAGSLGLRVGGDEGDDSKKERITELSMLFE